MTEMEKLVELLKSKKFTSEAEVEAYLKKNRTEKKTKSESPKMVFNERAASLIYANGFVVTLGKDGSISWAYDGKKIDDTFPATTPIVDQSDLQQCIEHIIGLHLKEKRDIWGALLQWKDQAKEGRTRYVKNDTKRAFISGMIHGKKHPNT